MLDAYHEASKRAIDEAEELVSRAIELREHAKAMLERANELAYEYAVAKGAADKAEANAIPW